MRGRTVRRLALAALILAVSGARGPVSAQTAENLQRAIQFYTNLEVDRARDLFLQVISPSSPFEVTTAQRVTAYKYLGAALATISAGANSPQRDSAITYFRAAIERDPFTDLDQTFSAQERAVFTESKRRVFKVGGRPVALDTIDPRTETIRFSVVTTHAANLVVEINKADEDLRFALYAGDNDGLKEITWNGSEQRGGLVPTGPYELIIKGTSMLATGGKDSTKILFDITQQFAALDDTVRNFAPADLLPETYPPSDALKNLILGGVLAVTAAAIPFTLGFGSLNMPPGPALGVSALGAIAGVVAYVSLTNRPEIPANVAENARRRAARDQANQAIITGNNEKLAATKLIFTPVAAAIQ